MVCCDLNSLCHILPQPRLSCPLWLPCCSGLELSETVSNINFLLPFTVWKNIQLTGFHTFLGHACSLIWPPAHTSVAHAVYKGAFRTTMSLDRSQQSWHLPCTSKGHFLVSSGHSLPIRKETQEAQAKKAFTCVCGMHTCICKFLHVYVNMCVYSCVGTHGRLWLMLGIIFQHFPTVFIEAGSSFRSRAHQDGQDP